MKFFDKLDKLQTVAQMHPEDKYLLYLIEALSEYAQDEDMPAGFLAWFQQYFNAATNTKDPLATALPSSHAREQSPSSA